MNYYVGDSLDTAGLTLTASYSDGSTQTVSSGFSCSPSALSTAGSQTVTVTWEGKTASFIITVEELIPVNITSTLPNKTEYYVGDTLDTTGLTIIYTYNSGKQETISSGYTCTPMILNTEGIQQITVSYNDISFYFNVTVLKKPNHVGDYFTFGSYGGEQIEWLVLAVDGSKALLISRYGIEAKAYNSEDTGVTWENCTLRSWLNSSFYDSAFTATEKGRIRTTTVQNDDNPDGGIGPTPGGNTTYDKVFLLSINEANNYFGSDSTKICYPTQHASTKCWLWIGGTCWWWLRSPGAIVTTAAYVKDDGVVDTNGWGVTQGTIAVRPALWYDFGS